MTKTVKKKPGQPSAYRKEYVDQAYKLCLLGVTDLELADFFGVVEQTLHNWRKAHPEFLESTTRGKTIADAEVAHSLFKRATGYVGKKVITASDKGSITDIQTIDDHVGPDTAAASLWLRNRQSAKWRDKQDIEHSGTLTLAQALKALEGEDE